MLMDRCTRIERGSGRGDEEQKGYPPVEGIPHFIYTLPASSSAAFPHAFVPKYRSAGTPRTSKSTTGASMTCSPGNRPATPSKTLRCSERRVFRKAGAAPSARTWLTMMPPMGTFSACVCV